MFGDYEPNMKYDEANKCAYVDIERHFTRNLVFLCVCISWVKMVCTVLLKKIGYFYRKVYFRELFVVGFFSD